MIQLRLSVKGAKEGVVLNLPATPAEVSEACAWFNRLDIGPSEVQIIDVNSSIQKLGQYISGANVHSSEDMEKLNRLAEAIDQMDSREQHIFAGALDAEGMACSVQQPPLI